MSEYIHKRHNISVLLYHLVCPAKYRRVVFTDEVDRGLREVCMEITKRYEISFIEIGVDKDHVHFFSYTVCTDEQSWSDSTNSEGHNSEGDIKESAISKEAVVGWRVLDKGLFYQHSWAIWE